MYKYGVDVGAIRLDDLDKKVCQAVAKRRQQGVEVSVLDIGCGAGGLATALATLGANVTALDIDDYQSSFATNDIPTELKRRITFVQADIREYVATLRTPVTLVVMQRVLHYLRYEEAVLVFRTLASHVKGEFFLSVTGASTEIAHYYPYLERLLNERFGILSPPGQEKFSMTAPVCLYTETEVIALLQETGWQVVSHRVSDFGNIKVVTQPL